MAFDLITAEWKAPPQLNCDLATTIPYICWIPWLIFVSFVDILSRSFAADLAFGRLRPKNVTSLRQLSAESRASCIIQKSDHREVHQPQMLCISPILLTAKRSPTKGSADNLQTTTRRTTLAPPALNVSSSIILPEAKSCCTVLPGRC
ncbi:hypothetical protein BJX66DRAFT_32573 [Aspergillus keveii]|uniref:Uncharacterized protein n=1 Tax=Aspergillus keveii TaxID=714993 RepID=A0ABR4FTQ1_9EURO